MTKLDSLKEKRSFLFHETAQDVVHDISIIRKGTRYDMHFLPKFGLKDYSKPSLLNLTEKQLRFELKSRNLTLRDFGVE